MEPGREGGTWLAASGRGGLIKFGALLNLTGEPKVKDAAGRGPIVSNYVNEHISNCDYTKQLIQNDESYNSFNFVSVEIE